MAFNFGNVTGSSGAAAATFVQGSTKFSELQDKYSKTFETLETHIREQTRLSDEILDHLKGAAQKDKLLVESFEQEVSALSAAVDRQRTGISSFAEDVRAELKNAEVAGRNLKKLVAPAQGGLQENLYLPSQYHWRKLGQLTHRMSQLQRQIDELDEHLATAEQQRQPANPKALVEILHGEWQALKAISTRAASLHAAADKARNYYARMRGEETHVLFREARPDTGTVVQKPP